MVNFRTPPPRLPQHHTRFALLFHAQMYTKAPSQNSPTQSKCQKSFYQNASKKKSRRTRHHPPPGRDSGPESTRSHSRWRGETFECLPGRLSAETTETVYHRPGRQVEHMCPEDRKLPSQEVVLALADHRSSHRTSSTRGSSRERLQHTRSYSGRLRKLTQKAPGLSYHLTTRSRPHGLSASDSYNYQAS